VILACVVFTQCHRVTDGQTYVRTDRQTGIPIVANTGLALVGAYARSLQLGAARTQQKTSALGKPDADLFIARKDRLTRDASQPN